MANVTYTVKKGDTLTAIAKRYDTTVNAITKLNNISNPNYIVVGQVLIISGTADATTENYSYRPIIKVFGLQSNTDRTVFATWQWDKKNTDYYAVNWTYYTGDGVGFIGDSSQVDVKQSVYTAPENANYVTFTVRPYSKKRKVNGKDTSYWTASTSTKSTYHFSQNPPVVPSVPSVEITDYTLTAELNNIDDNTDKIRFVVMKDNSSTYKTVDAKVRRNHASFSCTIAEGSVYKVRCRAIRGDLESGFSEWSDNYGTVPSASSGIGTIKALSETSVYLDWGKVSNVDSYEIEYATQKQYLGSSNETQTMSVESDVHHAEITGLETGTEWFFRVRSVNSEGSSAWTAIKSITLGKAPSAPTTWSSTTTAIVGENLTLYWVHNSEDGSSETYANLELDIDGGVSSRVIQNDDAGDDKDKTKSFVVDTSGYPEGTKIKWRVRTQGVVSSYGDWSIKRTVDIYAPPSVGLSVVNSEGVDVETLESFPFYVSATTAPSTQIPIGFHVSIKANEQYETVDDIGNTKIVNAGEVVYSKHLNSDTLSSLAISAGDVNLENNISYTLTCVASMNSGLTGESSIEFSVSWDDILYSPEAEIGYDKATYSTHIRPYCMDNDGRVVPNVTLSLYRREYDGSFTEIAKGLSNTNGTYVTDPHPALDYARYRVVAMDDTTGAVSYTDIPGYPIGETAVIIQWDETWSNFDITSENDELEQPAWTGSLLRLPYNIDVSDKHSSDVSLVEYIGRKYPVSYYGTQLGESSNWRVDIEKDDKETLYALRRLAVWMGDVYVREPSGTGYWANVSVSFSQKHADLVIPVTLDINRVAGGV